MDNNSTNNVFTLHNTYYIVEPNNNSAGRGSLAINPEINNRTHLISWQDTSLNPKSIKFKKAVTTPNEDEVRVITMDNKILVLKLLTLEIFNDCIRGEAPPEAKESDESLRRYYQEFIDLSNAELELGG